MTHPQRRWYRWHFSSLLVVILAVLFFVLVSIPGGMSGAYWPMKVFGWPYVHYVCHDPGNDFSFNSDHPDPFEDAWRRATLNNSRWLVPAHHTFNFGGFWSDLKHWMFFQQDPIKRILWPGLMANLVIALSVSFGVGGLFEWRRRRRGRLFQFTITELFSAMTCLTVCLAIAIYHADQVKQDHVRLSRVNNFAAMGLDSAGGLDGGPPPFSYDPYVWIFRLADHRITPGNIPESVVWLTSRRLNAVSLQNAKNFVGEFEGAQKLAGYLDAIPCLDTLHLGEPSNYKLRAIQLCRHHRITTLTCSGVNERQVGEILAMFPNIRHLSLMDAELEMASGNCPVLNDLEELELQTSKFGDKTMEWLSRQTRLRVLTLHVKSDSEVDTSIQARLPGVYVRWVVFRWMGGGSFGGQ